MWAHPRSTATAIAVAILLVLSLGSPVAAATTPATVTGLKATPSTSSATLTWSAAKNANTYRVCLMTSGSTTTCSKLTDATTKLSMTITGLKPTGGTDYFFQVRAYNGSEVSKSAKGSFDLTTSTPPPVGTSAAAVVPAKVTGISTVVGYHAATVKWPAAANAQAYSVCLMTSASTTTCYRATAKTTALSLTFTNLNPTGGTDYFAKVYSWNGKTYTGSEPFGFNLKSTAPVVKPSPVTGMKASVYSSSATITWPAAKNADAYVACLIADETNVCTRTSSKRNVRTATFTGLTPNAGTDYYYRVYSWRGTQSAVSATSSFDLTVGNVPGFQVTASDKTSISLAWGATFNADRYEVQLALNAAMTSGLRTYPVGTTSYELTPLIPGTTYYLRVRALNGTRPGAQSAVNVRAVGSNPFSAKVMTYNLCGQDKCVNTANGMKKWSTRKPLAGALVRGTGADIIATQESHDRDTKFITELPGYSLASYISAKSLFFNTAKYTKVRSGTITLDSKRKRYAVWAELEDKTTRTNFIVADAHLESVKGKANDDLRFAQTNVLISQIRKINPTNLSVVYAGDYNSNPDNANQTKYPGGYDAPLKAFTQSSAVNSFNTSTTQINPTWNSANQAKNPPLKHSHHVDHVYVDARILATSWQVVVKLAGTDYATPFATDHNPVMATLTIPGNP